jgi:hypothetical protein
MYVSLSVSMRWNFSIRNRRRFSRAELAEVDDRSQVGRLTYGRRPAIEK